MSTVSQVCSPALVYMCFSLIHVFIDIYKREFESAALKATLMIIITMLLNILCDRGLTLISWMIVLIPVMFLTFVIVLLIYFLGFKPGQFNKMFNVENDMTNTRYEITTKERFANMNM